MAVSLTACEKDNRSEGKTLFSASTSEEVDSLKPCVNKEKNSANIENSVPEQEPTYYHAAICGAVVVEQDGSAHFTYVKKCEKCATVQSGSSGANATGGVLHSSFLCSSCGETQRFEIKTTKN